MIAQRRRALMAAAKAGGGGGGSFGEEITFSLYYLDFSGFYTLTALDGMTWGDWCDSQYNTLGVYIDEANGDKVTIIDSQWGNSHMIENRSGIQTKNDLIVAGAEYYQL